MKIGREFKKRIPHDVNLKRVRWVPVTRNIMSFVFVVVVLVVVVVFGPVHKNMTFHSLW